MGNYPWKHMNHKLTNGMAMWKGNGNTVALQFFLKAKVYKKKEEAKWWPVTEHFNSIVFHKSIPVNKQHTYQSVLNKRKIPRQNQYSVWFFRLFQSEISRLQYSYVRIPYKIWQTVSFSYTELIHMKVKIRINLRIRYEFFLVITMLMTTYLV